MRSRLGLLVVVLETMGCATAKPTAPPRSSDAGTGRPAVYVAPGSLPNPQPLSALLDGPKFTPFSVKPEILNLDEVIQMTQDAYPADLQKRGVEGTARVFFLIDSDGTVLRRVLQESTGVPELDDAAMRVSGAYRFSPARYRDTPVPVWVLLPIVFRPPSRATWRLTMGRLGRVP